MSKAIKIEKHEVEVLLCDMCKEAELIDGMEKDIIGVTFPTLYYQILKAFQIGPSGEVKARVQYKDFPDKFFLLEQRVTIGEADRFMLCYSCYDKVKKFIESTNEGVKQ